MNQTSETLITNLLIETEELHRLLVRERGILSGPHTTNIANIAASKEDLIESIQNMMLQFNSLSTVDSPQHPSVQKLKGLLAKCMVANNENNALVNQRLSIVRQSISLVRTAVDTNDLQLYTNSGKPTQSSIRRSLTNA